MDRTVEHIPHLLYKRRRRKGFLKKSHAWLQNPALCQDVVCITRHIQHARIGMLLGDALREFASTGSRNNNVRQEKMNGSRMFFGETLRRRRILRQKNLITV